MSYLVLALGGFLALAGGAVIHASYPVIEVERGWAGVIAGTVALASGIVTIALGLILHRLASFQALLSAGRSMPGIASSAFTPAQSPHLISKSANLAEAQPPSPAAIPPASGLRSWPQRHARAVHIAGRNILKPAPAPVAPKSDEPPAGSEGADDAGAASPAPSSRHAMPAGRDAEAAAGLAPLGSLAAQEGEGRGDVPSLPLEMETGSHPLAKLSLADAPLASGETIEEPPAPGTRWPAEHALIEAAVPEAAAAAHGGAEAIQKWAEETWPGLRGLEVPQPAPVLTEAALSHPPESAISGELPSGHAIADDTLAIAGRYESDGTSYVMYADGSIEARTDHAVFHFKSMAELKSFMESQAHPPKE